jgi:hypothetical protein
MPRRCATESPHGLFLAKALAACECLQPSICLFTCYEGLHSCALVQQLGCKLTVAWGGRGAGHPPLQGARALRPSPPSPPNLPLLLPPSSCALLGALATPPRYCSVACQTLYATPPPCPPSPSSSSARPPATPSSERGTRGAQLLATGAALRSQSLPASLAMPPPPALLPSPTGAEGSDWLIFLTWRAWRACSALSGGARSQGPGHTGLCVVRGR